MHEAVVTLCIVIKASIQVCTGIAMGLVMMDLLDFYAED